MVTNSEFLKYFEQLYREFIIETGQLETFERWRESRSAWYAQKRAARARLLEQFERDWAAQAERIDVSSPQQEG